MIEFNPVLEIYLRERNWPGLKNLTKKDNRLIMELKVGVTSELIAWILSFGDMAQVLEPEELRKKITERLRATLKLYK